MYIHHYKVPYKNYLIAAFHSPAENAKEIKEWCRTTLGPEGYRCDTEEVRWRDNIHYGEVLFGRESDLMMFLLRFE